MKAQKVGRHPCKFLLKQASKKLGAFLFLFANIKKALYLPKLTAERARLIH